MSAGDAPGLSRVTDVHPAEIRTILEGMPPERGERREL